ncbi:hypothetical protein HYE11_01655 [Mycoplasmopsis bovis]|nr:hypothetical protein HYE11_01655 [Mycoplasmopsis bovis]
MDKKFRILGFFINSNFSNTCYCLRTCNSKKEQDKNNEKNQKNELMTPPPRSGNLNQQDKNNEKSKMNQYQSQAT